MSEQDLIAKIAEAVAKHVRPTVPLSVDNWDIEHVAAFFKRDVTSVGRITCLPDFPAAIRLPSAKGRNAHPLYKAVEVIAFADKYKEKRK